MYHQEREELQIKKKERMNLCGETLTFDNFTLEHICDAALTLIHCDLSQTV